MFIKIGLLKTTTHFIKKKILTKESEQTFNKRNIAPLLESFNIYIFKIAQNERISNILTSFKKNIHAKAAGRS